jgi:peroxiredoxin
MQKEKMMRGVTLMLFLASSLLVQSPARAGKYNQKLDIGDSAPAWKDLPGTDGETHSFVDLKEAEAVVVVFTCNSCPYAVDAEDRLIELTKRFQDRGVAVVAINVNTVKEDRMPAMKARSEQKGFPFLYLFDESQEIGKAYGAGYTPEFFVLDGDRRIVYMGSLDDSPEGKQVTKTYVADAIHAVLDGKQVDTQETVPIGCRIRYERQRRSRRQ